MKLLRAISFLIASCLTAAAQQSQGPTLQISKENRTISISASDHAEADPDIADIQVGFIVYGPTLQAAYKAASDSSTAIIKAMIDAGATRADIQSQSQRVSRLQDFEIKLQKGMKYSVVQSWTVSVDPSKAALILDAAVQSGANQSGAINWRMRNSIALDEQAIHRATERATAMATELAKTMNVTLGRVLFATNCVAEALNFGQIQANAVNGIALFDRRAQQAAPLSIEAQRVDRTATVQIVYSIE